MTFKSLLAVGLTSFVAYEAYKHRTHLKNTIKGVKDDKDLIQLDLDKIKANLELIQKETRKVQELSDDLNHKLRVFNQESQPVIDQIKNRMAKYQAKTE
ncbi:chemotaxis protein [Streptococcus catagoni]|uniref:chemotaxis protein n=1 Tax=Streptococcus catagoni TaxID=2654874 RepID=UPI00140BC228|nr:chemotaxis protein [Streptococcus catagoni]